MPDVATYTLLGVVVSIIVFDAGMSVGRRNALDNVVGALRKMPLSKEIRQAIDEALKTP